MSHASKDDIYQVQKELEQKIENSSDKVIATLIAVVAFLGMLIILK